MLLTIGRYTILDMKVLNIKKIAIPCQDNDLGSVFVKSIEIETDEGIKKYLGIGDDEWVIKFGIEYKDIKNLLDI